MSTVRTLVVTVTNDEEGISIALKSSPETGKIVVAPNDPGVYNLDELEAAIKACKEFT